MDPAFELIESVPYMRVIWDEYGKSIKACDDSFSQHLGISGGELRQKVFHELVHDTDRPLYLENLNSVMSSPKFVHSPYKLHTADDTVRWVSETVVYQPGMGCHVSFFLDMHDSIERDTAHCVPIEQSRLAELLDAEYLFKKLTETIPAAILLYQHDRWVFANRAAEQISGFSREEILSMNFWDHVHPDFINRIRDEGRSRERGEPGICNHIFKIITKQGETRWMNLTGDTTLYRGENAGIIAVSDVTGHMETMQKLKESEQRFRFLSDVTFEAIITHNDGIIEDVNRAFEQLTGFSKQEAVGHSITENLFDEHSIRQIQENMVKDHAEPYEILGTRKDGTRFWAEIEGRDVKREGKTIRIASIRDISRRKESQQLLSDQAQIINDLLNKSKSNILIYELPEDGIPGRHVMANDIACSSLGYTREQLLQMTPGDITVEGPPNPPGLIPEAMRDLLRDGNTKVTVYCRDSSGNERPYHLDLYTVQFQGRRHVLTFSNDISEQLAYEKQLKSQRDLLQGLFDSLMIGILVFDDDGIITHVNSAVEHLCGYRYTVGSSVRSWFGEVYPDDRYRELVVADWKEASTDGDSTIQDLSVMCADGIEREIEFRARFLEDGRTVVSMTNITERNLYQEAMHKMDRLESLGTLAGGIAHDFNNILTGLFGNLEMAASAVEAQHPAMDYLKEAERSMERARDLTGKLLTFAKGGAPVLGPVDIASLAENVIRFDLSGSNVASQFSFDEGLWYAEVDSTQMQQVFSNLAINADQAMPEGGLLSVSFRNCRVSSGEVTGLAEGDYIRVLIEDEGHGIEERHLKHIFDPYFTTKKKGNGLGLATVYSILERHHGLIMVSSHVGRGTSFCLYVPAANERDEAACTEEEEGHVDYTPILSRVLLMDDEQIIIRMLTQMIEHLGVEADAAVDGTEVLEMYAAAEAAGNPYELVIMDLTIPGGMGGEETIGLLKEQFPDSKVIVSSGYAEDPIIAQYESYGFSGVLKKPYTIENLKTVLNEILRDMA